MFVHYMEKVGVEDPTANTNHHGVTVVSGGFGEAFPRPTESEPVMASKVEYDDDQYSFSSNELHVSLEDLLPLQHTPEPGGDYCGPATTPAFLLSTGTGHFYKRSNSENVTRYGGGSFRHDKSYRRPEISYPFNMSKPHATQNNMDYYYTQSSNLLGENTSPRWPKPLTAPPFQSLYDDYRRQLSSRKGLEKFAPRKPTPGERALVRGWENNTGKAGEDRPDSQLLHQAKEVRRESAVTQAFPPSRVLVSRGRTVAGGEFRKSVYRDTAGRSAKVRRSTGNPQHQMIPRVASDVGYLHERFNRGGEIPNNLEDQKPAQRKRRNYLNFMTRATCPIKQFGKHHRDGNSTLPSIHVKPTVLTELRTDRRFGISDGKTAGNSQSDFTRISGRDLNSDIYSNENTQLIPKRLPKRPPVVYKRSQTCVLCIPTAATVG